MDRGLNHYIPAKRKKLGISAAELAENVGMSPAYLSQIESGARKWPKKYAGGLARELGIPEFALAIYAGVVDFDLNLKFSGWKDVVERIGQDGAKVAETELNNQSVQSKLWLLESMGIDLNDILPRPSVEALDPESVEAEMVGLVRRIHWTDERAATIRLVLRQWLEMDRKKG